MNERSRRRLVVLPLALATAAVFAAPALAGTDGDDEVVPPPPPAPIVQPVAPPAAPAPAPAAPAPAAPAPEAPAPVAKARAEHSTHAHKATKKTAKHTAHRKTVTFKTTSQQVKAVKAVATPSGGVQAGEGGTAPRPTDTPLGVLIGGGLVLLLAAGGLRVHAIRAR